MRDGLSLSDFASMVPFAVSTLEILPQNSDLVMSGPFEEPDESTSSGGRRLHSERRLLVDAMRFSVIIWVHLYG